MYEVCGWVGKFWSLEIGNNFNSKGTVSETLYLGTVSYDEIKQKVITQANDYHRVKAYTP